MFRVLTCSKQPAENINYVEGQTSLECSCIRPPLPNTIQAFGEEIASFGEAFPIILR